MKTDSKLHLKKLMSSILTLQTIKRISMKVVVAAAFIHLIIEINGILDLIIITWRVKWRL